MSTPTICPECGGVIQATTKLYWTLAVNGTWELYAPSDDNEVEYYCENDHKVYAMAVADRDSLRAEVAAIDAFVAGASKPVVVVIERPHDDPDVLSHGDVDVIELSAYPVSSWCPDEELSSYDGYVENVTAARDRFAEGSHEYTVLNELIGQYHARRDDTEVEAQIHGLVGTVLDLPGVVPEFAMSRSCFMDFATQDDADRAVAELAKIDGIVEHQVNNIMGHDQQAEDGEPAYWSVYFTLNCDSGSPQEDAFIAAATNLGGTYSGS